MPDDDPVREGDEPESKAVEAPVAEPVAEVVAESAASAAAVPSESPAPAATDATIAATAAGAERVAASPAIARTRRAIPWWSFVLAALVIEFYLYGRSGHIEVCVGKQGETDFTLTGKQRNDDNRWKFPRCESRTNLGLVSHRDELTKEAVMVACRGATIFRHQGEGKACSEDKGGWEHHVELSQCPPWHGHFYEHLFWFLK